MLGRLTILLAISAAIGGALFWILTIPKALPSDILEDIEAGDAGAGKLVFYAGGCSSCHAAKGAKNKNKLILGGRHRLDTPFGVFFAPNISPDKTDGIGSWTGSQFANAMLGGVSPEGRHYYPVFPFTSYARMDVGDVADLWAYMKTLEPAKVSNLDHELPLMFKFRRGVGLWKLLFLDDEPIVAVDESDKKLVRGRYLVEGLGHCGECHTPRNAMGGLDLSKVAGWRAIARRQGKYPQYHTAQNRHRRLEPI